VALRDGVWMEEGVEEHVGAKVNISSLTCPNCALSSIAKSQTLMCSSDVLKSCISPYIDYHLSQMVVL
jgi:hypothetical protein